MDSDQLTEPSPKRQRTQSYRPAKQWNSDDDSGEDLWDHFSEIPTQPLQRYQRPVAQHPTMSARTQSHAPQSSLLMDTLKDIGQDTYQTQPTQPLSSHAIRSSPEVEVLASSPISGTPHRPVPKPRQFPLSIAPPGTSFKRPNTLARPKVGGASQMTQSSQPVDPLYDPPTVNISDDDDVETGVGIRPTRYVTGAAPVTDFSKFAYNDKADDMSNAYGGGRRRNVPVQRGPSKAQPVNRPMRLEDIDDPREREFVGRLQTVANQASVRDLLSAARKTKLNFDDAANAIFAMNDLTSSDIESNAAKTAAMPVRKMKQNIKAEKTIMNTYNALSPLKKATKATPIEIGDDSPPPRPRRRLQQGRKRKSATPEEAQDEEQMISVKSDTESEEQELDVAPGADSDERLLAFMNTAGAADLADLANVDMPTAELIISKRPFRNLAAIRAISAGEANPPGKRRTTRKTIGEKVLDVAEDMWEGYEAVDKLVDNCHKLGQPIFDVMRKWGLNVDATSKTGELEVTKLDEGHDSGIGTPSSSHSLDLDLPNKKKKSTYLRQPEIMSKDRPMKDYQVFGLNWLNLLWSKRLSCILADDMGLGKTCQVVAFIAHLKEIGIAGTHLVIVPGSTLENWLREFKAFCPSIVFQPYYGSMAERMEAQDRIADSLDDIDVIVTTYETASNRREDTKFLRKVVRPTVVVYDEGHMLKNAEAKRHKELMSIPAEFRLLLTGTPLQNNLQELASLLGFILPQLFEESRESLRRIFSHKATTRDNSSHDALLSAQRIHRARSMMAPFILRRKKAQVLSSMPAKTRRIEFCDMVPAQAALWEELTDQFMANTTTTEDVKTSNKSKKNVHMMSLRNCTLHPLLLRRWYDEKKLKQIQKLVIDHPASELRQNPPDLVWNFLTSLGGDYAIHKWLSDRDDFVPPALLLPDEPWMTGSGKIPVFVSLLTSWISSGSRALIFSQFTSMLDILEAVLETIGMTFVRLDGSTPMADRQQNIDAFTNDTGISVFLLSTKAGGAGINLAAADKVLIMEAGFNPQDEIQAENRAHRVGQTREVEVVRLITRGTVEEMILKLGESKLALDERVGEGIGGGSVGAGAAAASGHGEQQKDEAKGEKEIEDMLFKSLEHRRKSTGRNTEQADPLSPSGRKEQSATKGTGASRSDSDTTDDGQDDEVRSSARRARTKRRSTTASGKTAVGVDGQQDIAGAFRRGLRRRGVDVA